MVRPSGSRGNSTARRWWASGATRSKPGPPLALDTQRRQALLDTINSARFADGADADLSATEFLALAEVKIAKIPLDNHGLAQMRLQLQAWPHR